MNTPEDKDVIYVFNHLQRSAGGALAAALAQRFRIVPDYQAGPDDADLARWLERPIALDSLRPGDMLMGHYTAAGGRLHERYPAVFESPRYRLLTFLREPLDWVESHLRYFTGEELGVQQTDDALDVLAGTFSRSYALPVGNRCTEPLDAYWFAGIYSRGAHDARLLLRKLGIAEDQLKRVNVSSERAGVGPLGPAQRERYRRLASADFMLYNDAVRRR